MFKILFISVWVLLHPVHVTMTSIDFVPEKACYNVFLRMFLDDFLTDSKINGEEINKNDIASGIEASRAPVEMYLSRKLKIKVNEKLLSGKLEEMNVADNEISMKIEYSGGRRPDIITVTNLIMTTLYADQSNMVIVKVNDFEEGVKLTSDQTERTFKIK
jgi:hypothetical protein